MNFDSVNFVRFLSAGGSLTRISAASSATRRRKQPRITDLGQLQNFAILSGGKTRASAVKTPELRRATSIQNDIYDEETIPTVENLKRLRALHGDLARFCWNATTARLFHFLRVRQVRP